MDTFKRAITKAGSSKDASIFEFLRGYRMTPNPAELMLGRKMRTPLDALRPPPTMEKNTKMERQFNKKHGARKRTFSSGDTVIFRPTMAHSWTPAKVLERVGAVMFTILCDDGRLLRVHINQLRPREIVTDDDLFRVDPQEDPLTQPKGPRVNPRTVTRSSPPVLRPRPARAKN